MMTPNTAALLGNDHSMLAKEEETRVWLDSEFADDYTKEGIVFPSYGVYRFWLDLYADENGIN